MSTQDYHSSFTTPMPPKEAFSKIDNVSQWWSTHFEGSAVKLGDVFTVRFKSGDWYKIRIDALTPDTKIVWNVLDADQTWHEDRDEWKGTQIVWEIAPEANGSTVSMTHVGLVPEAECYDQCKKGWDYLMQQSLSKYLADGLGKPV